METNGYPSKQYAQPTKRYVQVMNLKVSNTDSAYSTMEQMSNGHIGFFYEESHVKGGYQMVFCDYTLEQITGGEFK